MEKVAIIGSGLVSKSWAMIFASVGYKVTLYDIDPQQVQKALDNIKEELDQFEKDGVLRGNLKATQQQPLISGSTDLEQSVKVNTQQRRLHYGDDIILIIFRMRYTFRSVSQKTWI